MIKVKLEVLSNLRVLFCLWKFMHFQFCIGLDLIHVYMHDESDLRD